MHWITPLTDLQRRENYFFSSFLLSDLAACPPPLPQQRVNKNRQTNEGQQHIAEHSGSGLIDSPGDLSCVSSTANCNQKPSWGSNPPCSKRRERRDLLWFSTCVTASRASWHLHQRERDVIPEECSVLIFTSSFPICFVLLITSYLVAPRTNLHGLVKD